jgi:hypothetical protein
VPFLAGIIVAEADWVDAPLLSALLSGYTVSYFVLLASKSRCVRRHRDQLMPTAATAVPLAAVVIVSRPRVLLLGPVFAAALACVAWWGPWIGASYGWLVARGRLLPARAVRPASLGLLELASSALLLVVIAW